MPSPSSLSVLRTKSHSLSLIPSKQPVRIRRQLGLIPHAMLLSPTPEVLKFGGLRTPLGIFQKPMRTLTSIYVVITMTFTILETATKYFFLKYTY